MSEVPLYARQIATFIFLSAENEFFIDNLLVRIHLIIEIILVDRHRAMGVRTPFSRQPYTYLPRLSLAMSRHIFLRAGGSGGGLLPAASRVERAQQIRLRFACLAHRQDGTLSSSLLLSSPELSDAKVY